MVETHNLSISNKLREAGLHTIIYGLGSVAQSASGLILLPILTSSLSGNDFGAYSLILMASSIANGIFYFGMTSALPRSYFDFESDEDRKSVTTTAFGILILGALLQSSLGYIYRIEISRYFLGDEIYSEALFYGFISGATVFINTFLFGYLRLVKKSFASVLFSLISLIGTVFLTIYFLNNRSEHAVAPFLALLYANIIVTFVFLITYGRSAFNLKIIKLEIPVLLNLGAASIIASFGGLVIDSLDRLMIQKYFGLVEAGQFSAAIRVGMLVNVLFVVPFNQIWAPMALENRHNKNINQLFTKVFTAYIMFGGLLSAIASIFSWQILSLLIRSGVNADMIYVFIGCLIGVLVMSATNFFSAGLFYERRVSLLSFAYYGVAIIKFVINLLLIPLAGLIGAVLSVLISSTLVPVLVRKISKKYFDFDVEWQRLILFYAFLLPSFFYGIYSANNKSQDLFLNILLLLIQILVIIKFGISKNEKLLIIKLVKIK